MQYAPIRVRAKFGGFHIFASEYAKNAPDFTLPNRDAPKTHLVLYPNLRRKTFRGVCNTPLHGYMKNPSDFTFSNKDAPKTSPILGLNLRRGYLRGVCFCAPTRIHAKSGGFHIPAHDMAQTPPCFTPKPSARGFGRAYAIRPYTGTCKIWRVLGANPCRGAFRGVCNTPLHGYMQNLTVFGPKPSARLFEGRMQYAPTRVRA